MNGRSRRPPAAHGTKAAPKGDRTMMMQKEQRKAVPVKGPAARAAATKGMANRIQSRRERKLALQQDVEKLKKKLRHEENVHRALERAFTRPLGALPRLPPYLPSQTLALLAEVAVLEEEVVRLEEQVVNFRQGIYQEAIIFSSTKNAYLPGGEGCVPVPVPSQPMPSSPTRNAELSPATHPGSSDHAPVRPSPNGKQTPRKPIPAPASQDEHPGSGAGKENQSCSNTSTRNWRLSPSQKVAKSRLTTAAAPEKRRAAQAIGTAPDRKRVADGAGNNNSEQDGSSAANRLSEELLSCLLTIYTQMGSSAGAGGGQDEEQKQPLSPSVSGSSSSSEAYPQDPYGILELGVRDVGPYRRLHVIDAASFGHRNALAGNTLLARRLKALLRKLSTVDLAGLSHQQKLAFWINIYNSCMMNAFLEQGIPTMPHLLVAMMSKAAIEVGGRTHSAMSIELFILRLPYGAKHVSPECEGMKGDDAFGLEWPEPLVTFALSCGSWSSPAVRSLENPVPGSDTAATVSDTRKLFCAPVEIIQQESFSVLQLSEVDHHRSMGHTHCFFLTRRNVRTGTSTPQFACRRGEACQVFLLAKGERC